MSGDRGQDIWGGGGGGGQDICLGIPVADALQSSYNCVHRLVGFF